MKIKVTEFKLLAWLKDNPGQTSKDIAAHFNVTPPTVWKTLVPAVKGGRIEAKHDAKVPHYFITEQGLACHDKLAKGEHIMLYKPLKVNQPEKQKVTWQSLLLFLHTEKVIPHGGWGWTSDELAQHFGVSPQTVWKVLVPALKRGYLHKTQVGKKRYYVLSDYGKQFMSPPVIEKKEPGIFASDNEKLVYDTLTHMGKYYGAANVTMKILESGKKIEHSDVEKALESLFAKALVKKAPYKSYMIFKAMSIEEAQKIPVIKMDTGAGYPYKKHNPWKPAAAPKPNVIKAEDVNGVPADNAEFVKQQKGPNAGGAADVVLGEDEWLKFKEYGYKVQAQIKMVSGQPYEHHWDHFNSEKKAAIADWNLDATLNLQQECADFYALYDLSLDFDDVKPQFEAKRNFLAQQFANYIDMAVGGEFRHAAHRVSNKEALKDKAPIINLIMNGQLPAERSACWRAWKGVRKEKGLDALKQVEYVYKSGHWGGGFGGIKWGKGAETLRMFLEGGLTPTIFVDTVWALQHNNGFILNKVWSVHGLDSILNYKFAGNIEAVIPSASEDVKKLWKVKRNVA